jgi:hypothetical protein
MARGGTTSNAIRRMRWGKKADAEQWKERRRVCAHALLNRPWITKEGDPEVFYWIKDQYTELRDWFAEHTGFLLILTRTMAKLDKAPLVAEPWMGFTEFRDAREQLSSVGMGMDWENYQHRLSMVRALKKLRQLGVLVHIDGDETDWAHNTQKNVLYECSSCLQKVIAGTGYCGSGLA